MGLFDIFNSKPSKAAVLSQVNKAKEIYAQPDYRRMAMDKLLKWATPESYQGLIERFSVVVQSPHWDEEEKRWLTEELVKIGDEVLPILREFILKKNEVNHALLAYRKIAPEKFEDMLVEALKVRPPSDHRSVLAKQELIFALGEFNRPDLKALILPYLDDHSDDVQCAAITVLSKVTDQEIKEKLVKLLQNDEHSPRVLRTAAQVIESQKIPVGDIKLSEAVSEGFRIDSGYLVRI
jgi:HEAT repeat protein